MIDGAIYADGKVILRFFQPAPKYVRVGDREYVASVQHGVSLLFAEEMDVPAILGVMGGCCGGQKQAFNFASEMAYNVWRTGER